MSANRARMRKIAAAAVLVALAAGTAGAWGITAHQMVTYDAATVVEEPLAGFFQANMQSLVAFSNEPDLLSLKDPSEGPNHFIDLDEFDKPPFDDIPSDEAAFKARFGVDATVKGNLPWAIEDTYHSLVEAFRAKDLQAILKLSGYLSHYVADGTMPLHVTVNYKGQYSGNVIFDDDSVERHVHVRWEIGMVDANGDALEAAVRKRLGKAHTVSNPAAEALDLAKGSYKYIDEILRADRALLALGGKVTPAYYAELYRMTGEMAADRLALAADEVASYWMTAWREAGSPELLAARVMLTNPPMEETPARGAAYHETPAQPATNATPSTKGAQ